MNKGSATKLGYLYHEPAFDIEDFNYHRRDNRHRLEVLLRSQDWWGKNVLDLGCNIGYFSLKLALEGARVVGVDTDTEALKVAREQAIKNCVEGVHFTEPTAERGYTRDKDVLLALSVLPWIYETEQEPEKYLDQLFEIPVAYVELPYAPDGRAQVPGVHDDQSAMEYLRRWYHWVYKAGETLDETDGVVRKRTIWKCLKSISEWPSEAYGSQAVVSFGEHVVAKKPREGKNYSAAKELEALKALSAYGIAPEPICLMGESLLMARIHGWPLTTCKTNMANLVVQFDRIAKALEQAGIEHHDIRPANLILGRDYNVYLIDFGWATRPGEPKPEKVNPLFGGATDRAALDKILMHYPLWQSSL